MISSDEEFILLDSVLPKLKKKRIGVHDINTQRNILGEYHHLFPELKCHPDRFRGYIRMTPEIFEYVCNWQRPILPEERLVVTLRTKSSAEMARNEEKQLARLNRFYLQQQREEEIKKRPPRPRLDSLHTVADIKVWLPSIMRDIDFYVNQMEVPCFPARQIEQFEQRIDHLRGEYKAFMRKIRQLDPDIDAAPWSQHPYNGKRRKVLTNKTADPEKNDKTNNDTATVAVPKLSKDFTPIATPVLNKDDFYKHCYGYEKPKELVIPKADDIVNMIQDRPLEFNFMEATPKKSHKTSTEDLGDSINHSSNEPLRFIMHEALQNPRHEVNSEYKTLCPSTHLLDSQGLDGGSKTNHDICSKIIDNSQHQTTLKLDPKSQNDSTSVTSSKNIDNQTSEKNIKWKLESKCNEADTLSLYNIKTNTNIQIKGSINIPYSDSSSSDDNS